MNKLYDVLEVCIQDVENGADVETVLFRYPEFAEELRPMLETVVKARSVAVAGPAPDVVRRNRAKVLQHAAQLREAKVQPSRSMWTVTLRRTLVSLAVIAMLFISSTSLVRAASTTIPGDNLYPVKRTWEDVRVLFTFDIAARTALEVEHENERLYELTELFARGRSVRVDFSGLVTRQNGTLWRVAGIPVVLPPQADVRDPIAVGDAVRVRGVTQVDGSVLAERVELLDAGAALPDVEDDPWEGEQDNSGNENENENDNSGPGSENESNENSGPDSQNDDSEDSSGSDDNDDDSNDNAGNDNSNDDGSDDSRDDSNDNDNDDDNSGSGSNDDNDNDDNSGSGGGNDNDSDDGDDGDDD